MEISDLKVGITLKRIIDPNKGDIGKVISITSGGDFLIKWINRNESFYSSTYYLDYWEVITTVDSSKSNQPFPQNKKREERPCKVCQRINDCGVNKCWWCEIESPC